MGPRSLIGPLPAFGPGRLNETAEPGPSGPSDNVQKGRWSRTECDAGNYGTLLWIGQTRVHHTVWGGSDV